VAIIAAAFSIIIRLNLSYFINLAERKKNPICHQKKLAQKLAERAYI